MEYSTRKPVPDASHTPQLTSVSYAGVAANPQLAASAPKHLWFALHLPLLSLEALEPADRTRERDRRPRVVVEVSGQQQVVIACNGVATARGITAGMAINAAYALASQLQVCERQAETERQLLEWLAAWAGRFTPRVSLEPPDALLLEVKGSRKLFGGLAALGKQIALGVHEQGLTAWLALSPTPRAALWFARAGEKVSVTTVAELSTALARLPVSVVRWPEPTVALLASMGVGVVGECLRLPRDGFARRLNPRFLLELDQATGKAPEARRDFKPQMRFNAALDFAEEIENGSRLLGYIEVLIDDLAQFLEARQAGVQALVLDLFHRGQAPTRQVFRFAALATQRAHFVAVMHEQLSRLQLAAPARGARLRSGSLLLHAVVSNRFFFAANAHEPQQVARLFEKLRARLGAPALYSLEAMADHRPEHAWRKRSGSFFADRTAQESGSRAPTVMGSRPAWLLADPQPLEQKDGWPDCNGPLTIRRGPERIEGGWWMGKDIARDYYVARTAAGLQLWIYRERQAPQGWFLHGIFG